MQRVYLVGTATLVALMAAHRQSDNGRRLAAPCPADPRRAPTPGAGVSNAMGELARPVLAISPEPRLRHGR
jgi:hypothetical protein